MDASASLAAKTSGERRFATRSQLNFTPRDRANIRSAADLTRLLPGEDPATERPEEIEHWIARYAELAAFNRELIERLAGPSSLDRSQASAEAFDLPLARAHALRIRLRHFFWMARGRDLRRKSIRRQTH